MTFYQTYAAGFFNQLLCLAGGFKFLYRLFLHLVNWEPEKPCLCHSSMQNSSVKAAGQSRDMSDEEYTIWKLVAAKYIHPETLQAFAVLSSAHRNIVEQLARTTDFWNNLKSTSLAHASREFDPTSLTVLKELAGGPLLVPRKSTATVMCGEGDGGRDMGGLPGELFLFNSVGSPARDTEEKVRRFLKLCYFPLYRVSVCMSMLVIRNMPEMGAQEDSARMNNRVTAIIRMHSKRHLRIRGAYRMITEPNHLGLGATSEYPELRRKRFFGRGPNRPVLVIFETQRDADFVYARRGIFRRNLKVQLERCSMPWDMDACFKPMKKELQWIMPAQ